METRHQLDFYGYRESNGFVPRYCRCIVPGVSLTLSKEDGNVITIAKDGGIMVSLGLETDGKMLYLVNLATGARIGGVEAPGANAVTDFSMNGTEDQLTVCVKRADGTLKNIVINMGNVIRAYTAGDGIDITEYDDSKADYLLFDSGKGSGKTFDWNLIRKDLKKEFFIAGGLTSQNIKEAIMEFNPYAVDLSSSLEVNGFKDENKIREIMEVIS